MISQRTTLPTRVIRRVIGFGSKVRALTYSYRVSLESAVESEMQKLARLDNLKEEDLQRIKPVVYEAAQCHHAAHWWPIFKKARKDFYGIYAALYLATGALVAVIVYNALAGVPSVRSLGNTGANIIFMTLVILLLIRLVGHRRVPRNYLITVVILEAAAAAAAIHNFRTWSPGVIKKWNAVISPMLTRHHIEASPLPMTQIFRVTLWLLGAIFIVEVVVRGIHHLGFRYSSDVIYGYDLAAVRSAALILGFLDVSYSVKKVLEGFGPEAGWTGNPVVYSLRGSAGRTEVDNTLARLARLAKGPWRAAMLHTRRGTAGQWAAHQAPRIEFFLQQQRLRNMLVGPNLIMLKNAMTSALVQAADGNWDQIGERYPDKTAVSWLRSALRRLAVIVIAVVVAIFARNAGRSPYAELIVLTCLSFIAVQLLALIDPESSARLDVAAKFGELFRRSPHG